MAWMMRKSQTNMVIWNPYRNYSSNHTHMKRAAYAAFVIFSPKPTEAKGISFFHETKTSSSKIKNAERIIFIVFVHVRRTHIFRIINIVRMIFMQFCSQLKSNYIMLVALWLWLCETTTTTKTPLFEEDKSFSQLKLYGLANAQQTKKRFCLTNNAEQVAKKKAKLDFLIAYAFF